ncbi:MAG: bifunctional riboflavin kinase/FAD synthetase [Chamaesiphon sp.]
MTSCLKTALMPTAVALGNFDGVHRGHQQVLQPILGKERLGTSSCKPVKERSEFLPTLTQLHSLSTTGEGHNQMPNSDQSYPTVLTFAPHPQEFFTGQRRTLLTPLNEKVQQLFALGVEQLVLLPFDRELASLSPQQFVEKILVQHLRATLVSVGQDFCFGHQRTGTSADLQAIAASFGIDVTIVPLQNCQEERISSSCIRQSLSQGDVLRANELLGRPYTLTGKVVQGQKLGRTLGFPTANLQMPAEKFLPRQGVYCVSVSKIGEGTDSSCPTPRWKGMMNIGQRPTVNGNTTSVEVHLLDWSGDLYGQLLTVSLEQFLRPEQKFASLDALKSQIQADEMAARSFSQSTHK